MQLPRMASPAVTRAEGFESPLHPKFTSPPVYRRSMSELTRADVLIRELEAYASFFEGVARCPLNESDRVAIQAFLTWRGSPRESGVEITPEGPLPRKGDTVSWRGQLYAVTALFKSTVHLEGRRHSIRIRCLKPISEGGFSEAVVVRRAGY